MKYQVIYFNSGGASDETDVSIISILDRIMCITFVICLIGSILGYHMEALVTWVILGLIWCVTSMIRM